MDMVAPESRALVEEHFRPGDERPYNHMALRKDGTIFPVEIRGRMMPYEGRMVRMTAIVDITERLQAEQALGQSEERYRSIFETAAVSIWDEDFSALKAALDDLKTQGITDMRAYLNDHPEFVAQAAQMVNVRDVNAATLRIFEAKSKADLLGSLDKVFTPESLQNFSEEMIAIAEGQTYFEGETIIQTLHGERHNVLLTTTIPSEAESYRSVLVGHLAC